MEVPGEVVAAREVTQEALRVGSAGAPVGVPVGGNAGREPRLGHRLIREDEQAERDGHDVVAAADPALRAASGQRARRSRPRPTTQSRWTPMTADCR